MLNKKMLRTSEHRIAYFRRKLEKSRISFHDDSITLVINRDNILEDTLNQIDTTDEFDFHKEIKIYFVDEDAQDAGGVLKEWIFSLIQAIFTDNTNHELTKNWDSKFEEVKVRRSYTISNVEEAYTMPMKDDTYYVRNSIEAFNSTPQKNSRSSSFHRSTTSHKDVLKTSCNYETDQKLKSSQYNQESDTYMISNKWHNELYYQFSAGIKSKICTLLGQIIGKAIFESIPIEPKLTSFIIQWILSREFEIEDLANYDESIYRSMLFIKDTQINSSAGINFTVNDGKLGSVELIRGGTSVMVNESNKAAFLNIICDYYGYQRVKDQIDSFLEGLYKVIPSKTLNILEPDDFAKMLYGNTKIDIEDWKKYTKYTGKSENSSHQTITWFWSIIDNLNQSHLKKFLQFCTGCRSVPIEGFRGLKNNRKEECLFTINLVETSHGFIRAHACFNRIDLPIFESVSEVQKSIDYILSQKQFKFDFE